jgi:hypothetical protein
MKASRLGLVHLSRAQRWREDELGAGEGSAGLAQVQLCASAEL